MGIVAELLTCAYLRVNYLAFLTFFYAFDPFDRMSCMSSEFVIERPWQSNRRSPVRWLWSHVMRHPLPIVGVFLGALGNAALASAMPALTGRAFTILQASTPDYGLL